MIVLHALYMSEVLQPAILFFLTSWINKHELYVRLYANDHIFKLSLTFAFNKIKTKFRYSSSTRKNSLLIT